jgi:hypothetical protein
MQIVLLVFDLVLSTYFIFFMVFPFVKEAWIETRRIAELLAQLPSEIDVESMVSGWLLAYLPINLWR